MLEFRRVSKLSIQLLLIQHNIYDDGLLNVNIAVVVSLVHLGELEKHCNISLTLLNSGFSCTVYVVDLSHRMKIKMAASSAVA